MHPEGEPQQALVYNVDCSGEVGEGCEECADVVSVETKLVDEFVDVVDVVVFCEKVVVVDVFCAGPVAVGDVVVVVCVTASEDSIEASTKEERRRCGWEVQGRQCSLDYNLEDNACKLFDLSKPIHLWACSVSSLCTCFLYVFILWILLS